MQGAKFAAFARRLTLRQILPPPGVLPLSVWGYPLLASAELTEAIASLYVEINEM